MSDPANEASDETSHMFFDYDSAPVGDFCRTLACHPNAAMDDRLLFTVSARTESYEWDHTLGSVFLRHGSFGGNPDTSHLLHPIGKGSPFMDILE